MKFRWETEFRETEIGEIPKDWIKIKIKDIGRVVTGKTPPTKDKSFWDDDYPFITPSDIESYDTRYVQKVERYLSKKWAEKNKNLLIPPNTVCFVCIGSTIGKVCITKDFAFTNQQINSVVVNNDNYDPIFVYYLLRANQFRIKDEYGGGGAAKDIISKSKFENIILFVPQTKEEQTRIATVLSWFDDLIENKRRQNEILEKTAMAIFKSWFIDFEPFQDEEFVYSEELGMEIPKGWEVKPIGEVAEFMNGLSYKGSEKFDKCEYGSYIFITLNNVERGGGFKVEYAWIKSDRLKKRHFLNDEELIMANTDMTQDAEVIGSPAIVVFPPDYDEDVGVYSHHITRIRPVKEFYKLYLYLTLKNTQKENVTFSTGTNVLGLDIENFKQNKYILIPPQPIPQRFHSLVEPLFQKIINNQKQIMILKKIRDALLPQLVFGRLRVEEM